MAKRTISAPVNNEVRKIPAIYLLIHSCSKLKDDEDWVKIHRNIWKWNCHAEADKGGNQFSHEFPQMNTSECCSESLWISQPSRLGDGCHLSDCYRLLAWRIAGFSAVQPENQI